MPKISILIPEPILIEIDAQAAGNRTAFMLEAAVARARTLKRERLLAEIAETLSDSVGDDELMRDWEITSADGLD